MKSTEKKEQFPVLDYLCENTIIPDAHIYIMGMKTRILKQTLFNHSKISELFCNEIYKN